jgi:hypothetical protein
MQNHASNLSLDARRVVHVARTQYPFASEGMGIIEFVRVGEKQRVIDSFRKNEGRIPVLIRAALLERLVMAVNRMHDDPARDRDSLPRAFDLLRRPGILDEVASVGDRGQLADALSKWDKLRRSETRLERLRYLRNYYAAHTITARWGTQKATPNDLLPTAKRTFEIAADLAAGCGTNTVPLDAIVKTVWRKAAWDFWNRVIEGSAILKKDRKSAN